jgi:hypothetical protein
MRARRWITHALVLVLLLTVTQLARGRGETASAGGLPHRVAAMPAIPFLECASLGYRSAAADVAWLQAVQYYGEHRQGGNDLAEFRHCIDVVNALDPRYEQAAVFGAFVLATEKQDLDGALELLARSARANPDSPVGPFEMGFLTYVCGGDLEDSLRWLRVSAQRPGGRDRAQRFMAFLNRKLGRYETAWLLWNDIYRNTRDPGMRAVAAECMRRLEAQMKQAQP